MQFLITTLIPCHNAERWIGQAIQSALDQTYPHKEVIVVDDGSTDGSLGIINSFGSAIRWENGPNRGGNAARNRLLALAQGEWLQYLDADDYLLPGKVADQAGFLAENPDVDVVYGPVIMEHHDNGGAVQELLPIPEPHDPWILLARWYLPQTGAPLWRKQALIDVGGWKPDQPACQEHELYLRLLKAGKRFAYCPSSGAVYRQWGEHTVCKRDKPEVRRRRLDIEQGAEDHLRKHGELTPERLWAINMARFEMARIAWPTDRAGAQRMMDTVRSTQPDFVPQGAAAPKAYQWVYRMLGFSAAEQIAGWRRGLKGGAA